MQNLLVLAGMIIDRDEQGRLNLNALHRASGLGLNKVPSVWINASVLDTMVTESLNPETLTDDFKFVVKNTNTAHGTYATEVLAIAYADWLHPKFGEQFRHALLEFKASTANNHPFPEQRAAAIIATMLEVAERYQVPKRIALQVAAEEATRISGLAFDTLLSNAKV